MVGLVLGSVAAGASVAISTPAVAAEQGPGYGSYADGTFKGAHMVNGVPSWCAQPGVTYPTGTTADGGIVGQVGNADPVAMAQAQYATMLGAKNMVSLPLFNGQQTNANMWAAATQFVEQYLIDPAGMVADNGNTGAKTFDGQIAWAQNTIGGDYAMVKAIADQMLSDAQKVQPGSGVLQPIVKNNMDPAHNFDGTVSVTNVPVGATTTFTLNNARFVETGTNTATVTNAATLHTIGVPPTNAVTYEAGGTYSTTGDGGYPSQLHVYTTPGGQTTVSADGINNQLANSGSFSDPFPRNVPQVTSKAQVLASPGSDASETVTVTGDPSWFPAGGIDVTSTAYLMPGSAQVKGEKVSAGTKLYTSPAWITGGAGRKTWTIQTLDASATAGKHITWVHTWTNHDTGDVLGASADDNPNETTPIKEVGVVTTPQFSGKAGDSAQDQIDVNGWVKKGDYVVVTQFQVPAGKTLVCSPSNQIGPSLNPLPLTPGNNVHTKYVTQRTGAQVAGHAGFVEEYFRDGKSYKKGGCQDELFDMNGPKPSTPTPSTPAAVTPPAATAALPVIAG